MKLQKLLPILMTLSVILLTSCASSQYEDEDMGDIDISHYQLAASTRGNEMGGIYSSGTELSFFEDMKAGRVGDILTVILVEQTSGQNSSDNTVNQSTDMNVSSPTFGGRARPNMGINLNSANSFNGDSGSSQSNSLNGSITVTVRQVLANGNLLIQGEKSIRINQGNEFIRLQGVIRQKDIDAYNTLYSTQIADARISYGGKGTHGASNKPGWGAKLIFSSLWPF